MLSRLAGNGAEERKGRTRGVVYTPIALADWLACRTLELLLPAAGSTEGGEAPGRVGRAVQPVREDGLPAPTSCCAAPTAPHLPSGTPRVLDPACGEGSLLLGALHALVQRGMPPALVVGGSLFGLDSDPAAVPACRQALLAAAARLGAPPAALSWAEAALARHIRVTDALLDPPGEPFDAVLSNPPYIRAAHDDQTRRRRLRERYRAARGAFDLLVPFVELALRVLRPGGVLGLVTSNKWLVADYGARLRAMVADELELTWLLDLADAPQLFPGVLVSPVVVVGRKQAPPSGRMVRVGRATRETASLDHLPTRPRRQSDLLIGPRLLGGSEVVWRAAARMWAAGPPLGGVALVRGGVMGFAYRQVCEQLAEAEEGESGGRVLCPGNVGRYEVRWGQPVRLGGRVRRRPVLPRDAPGVSAAAWEFFSRPKVVVKGVARRMSAALDREGSVLLVALWGVADCGVPLEALLALLNSRPIAWLHRQQLHGARIPQGSFRFPLSWLKQLPVPAGVEVLAEAAAQRPAGPEGTTQARTERGIDRLVCDLYHLSARERRLVLGDGDAEA